uniref:Ig-like domain-containing protein n=1 Tax=Oncorhynchus tshawytscha TaxID=74940 RepID=A0AAZ3QLV1_ONCTS
MFYSNLRNGGTILCYVLCLRPGVSLSKSVYQSPSTSLVKPNASVTLNCSHKIPRYDTVLWYKCSVEDMALNLIAYIYYKTPTVEPSYKGYFDVKGDGENEAFLHILKPRQNDDSGEYFCAASIHSGTET